MPVAPSGYLSRHRRRERELSPSIPSTPYLPEYLDESPTGNYPRKQAKNVEFAIEILRVFKMTVKPQSCEKNPQRQSKNDKVHTILHSISASCAIGPFAIIGTDLRCTVVSSGPTLRPMKVFKPKIAPRPIATIWFLLLVRFHPKFQASGGDLRGHLTYCTISRMPRAPMARLRRFRRRGVSASREPAWRSPPDDLLRAGRHSRMIRLRYPPGDVVLAQSGTHTPCPVDLTKAGIGCGAWVPARRPLMAALARTTASLPMRRCFRHHSAIVRVSLRR
jgi:hypothetical protein